jgi:hypothetical protein
MEDTDGGAEFLLQQSISAQREMRGRFIARLVLLQFLSHRSGHYSLEILQAKHVTAPRAEPKHCKRHGKNMVDWREKRQSFPIR